MSKKEFKSENGDTLADLNRRLEETTARLSEARDLRRVAEAGIRPVRAAEESAEREQMNISTRLNIWWNEYREATGEKGKRR